ncbi:putative Heat-labile enterotoxin IIB, A chain [Purpureocillium lilacinum]|nr:putative Heat-labile enterotoxin IIB, A chain [Purpureocillium lilacinum]
MSQKEQEEQPAVVYRADMLSPDDLKRQQRFLPRGMDGTRPNQPPPDTSLFNHVSGTTTGMSRSGSGYVSTTRDINYARRFVSEAFGGRGYIYHIHVSGNILDVAGTLQQWYSRASEAEFSALGGIQYSQVLGWIEFREGVEQPEVRNPEYDRRFDTATTGGAQPQLAGFPNTHRAWGMDPWRAFAVCETNHISHEKRDEEQCHSAKSAVEFASEYIAAEHPISNSAGKKPKVKGTPCKYIDSLRIEAAIGDKLSAGTDDTIYAQVADMNAVLTQLFESPSAGQQVRQSVNLKKVFGKDNVPLDQITRIVVLQKTSDHEFFTDDFNLKSIYGPLYRFSP